MPTGYTYTIKDGISFEKFAMQCSRAFGALITMRDEPNSAEIPEKLEPDNYYQRQLEKDNREYEKLMSLSDEGLENAAMVEYSKEIMSYIKMIQEGKDLQIMYANMLKKVEEWAPPTKDHIGLKDFMVQQINKSIKVDCGTDYFVNKLNEVKLLSGKEWYNRKVARLCKSIAHNAEQNEKELNRIDDRNRWLSQLRDSLK